jgi:MFS family permease
MGTHSAFFVPAKYGVMPEILQPHLLSKGNGFLECTSFLAVIAGTVSGGMLTYRYRHEEYYIGLILVLLAVIGAVGSLLIRRMPAANPTRTFPTDLFAPLLANMRTLLRSKPLALAVLGIAFFTFMVAFMRGTVYMHGETMNPRWTEFETSMVVATVALGVGFGSLLAGSLSGGKVELGLVPLGAIGMIVVSFLAGIYMGSLGGLISCLVLIGFFSGFYIVPLYTLLQHRAPKASKGDLIATSNFLNVAGAIVASLLFFLFVQAAKVAGISRSVPQTDVAHGTLIALEPTKSRRSGFVKVEVEGEDRPFTRGQAHRVPERPTRRRLATLFGFDHPARAQIIIGNEDLKPDEHPQVSVSTYAVRGVDYFEVRLEDGAAPPDAYDHELVPRFLFIGASAMTLGILVLLCRQLPDFFIRALLWIRAHGRYRLKVVGVNNLPSNGPAILATNCDRFEECMQVIGATDRFTRFILLESATDDPPRPLLRYLARRTGTVALRPPTTDPKAWDRALTKAARALDSGSLVAVTALSEEFSDDTARLVEALRDRHPAPLLPVYCGSAERGVTAHAEPAFTLRRVQVVIGQPVAADTTLADIQKRIRTLGSWVHQVDDAGIIPATVMIPTVSAASPTTPAADPPGRP